MIDHTRSKSLAIVSSENNGGSAPWVYIVLPVHPLRIDYHHAILCHSLSIVDSHVITYTNSNRYMIQHIKEPWCFDRVVQPSNMYQELQKYLKPVMNQRCIIHTLLQSLLYLDHLISFPSPFIHVRFSRSKYYLQ